MKFNYTAKLACYYQVNKIPPIDIPIENCHDDTKGEHELQILIEHDIKLISQTSATTTANFVVECLYDVLRYRTYAALNEAGYRVSTTDNGFTVSWDHLMDNVESLVDK